MSAWSSALTRQMMRPDGDSRKSVKAPHPNPGANGVPNGIGVRLDVRYDGPIPTSILTDPTRLRQILTNLVGNAIKFTEEGGVQVVVTLGDAPDTLRFDVLDSGIGMTPEQVATIFRPFVQGDGSTTRRFGGTGLGLTICRRLAE